MKKTQEEYERDVFEFWGDDYIVLGGYSGALKKIRAKHITCGTEWDVIAVSLITGHGCPNCSNNRTGNSNRKTLEEFTEEVFSLWKNEYSILGKYVNSKTKIPVLHNVCKNISNLTPSDFLNGHGCPICAGNKKKTHTEFLLDVFNIVGDEYSVIGEYRGTHSKISMKHNVCGNAWKVEANSFLNNGRRCPNCSLLQSRGEIAISKFLESKGIPYESEYSFAECKNILPLPFDFYLPTYNYCIEYDGEFHYEINRMIDESKRHVFLENQRKRDKIKNKYCKNNEIRLIRIPYWEFKNIENILNEELY